MNNQQHQKLELKNNEFHLWFTQPQLCTDEKLLARYKSLLTEQETEKQQRYIFEKDRHSALVTRAFVRDVLSQYSDKAPEQWQFSQGKQGKPEIVNEPLPLRFNLSHTKDLIICAVTLSNDIGCDAEQIERQSDVLAIADRYFSKSETEALFSLPESEQPSRFFDYWTLKESYIKAWGQGLAIPLSDFSFHIGSTTGNEFNDNIGLSFSEKRQDEASHWKSWLFYPSAEHRVSVSIRSTSNQALAKEKITMRIFSSVALMKRQELASFNLS